MKRGDRVQRKFRQQGAAEREVARQARTVSQQIALASTRRGESKKEIARLRGSLRNDS